MLTVTHTIRLNKHLIEVLQSFGFDDAVITELSK